MYRKTPFVFGLFLGLGLLAVQTSLIASWVAPTRQVRDTAYAPMAVRSPVRTPVPAPTPSNVGLEFLSQFGGTPLGAGIRAVAAQDDCFFAAVSLQPGAAKDQLAIFDTTLPQGYPATAMSFPELGRTRPLPGQVTEVIPQDGFAYVMAGSLVIVDISDPRAPVVRSLMPGIEGDLYIDGNHAYILGQRQRWLIDVANPAWPAVVSIFPATNDISKLFFAGRYAYELTEKLIVVYDTTNLAAPTPVGTYGPLPAGSTHFGRIYAIGSQLVVSEEWSYSGIWTQPRVSIVDFAVPSSPILRSTVELQPGGWTSWLILGDDRLVVMQGEHYRGNPSRLYFFDVSRPEAPRELGVHEYFHGSGGFATRSRLYLDTEHYQYIYDITDTITARPVNLSHHAFSVARDVRGRPGASYIETYEGVRVVDLTDPLHPQVAAEFPVGNLHDIHLDDDRAYHVSYYKDYFGAELITFLHVLDLADPGDPPLVEVYCWDSGSMAQTVRASNGYAFVSVEPYPPEDPKPADVIDARDLAGSRKIGALDFVPEDVVVAEPYAYFLLSGQAGSARLAITAIDDLGRSVSSFDLEGWPVALFVTDQTAYVLTTLSASPPFTNRLSLLDVSDLGRPALLAAYTDFPPDALANDLYVDGQYAYVTTWARVHALDVSRPRAPVQVGLYNTPGGAQGVYASGELVHIADGDNGLVLLRNPQAASPTPIPLWLPLLLR